MTVHISLTDYEACILYDELEQLLLNPLAPNEKRKHRDAIQGVAEILRQKINER